MTDEIKILCDELCSHAGLNKAELLSGVQRVITQQELLALANAYASRISHYNFTLETHIRKPHVPANLKKIWTATRAKERCLVLVQAAAHMGRSPFT